MPPVEDIALFDMDGTLCDYDAGLIREFERLLPPETPMPKMPMTRDSPKYIQNLANLIRSSEEWWATLPKRQLGWDVLNIAKDLGYRLMILTQGPRSNPRGWSGKRIWAETYLPDVDMTITRDKGLVYGRVLVDDFPPYIERWLTWRKNGIVIMPATETNTTFSHHQVIRYDGSNLELVKERMAQGRRVS